MHTYETLQISDLPQATFLYASGVPLVGIEKINENRKAFCFERTDGTEELLMSFASGREILIVPSQLLSSYKHLKSLLWNQR
ncbi:hypothetical protein KJ652_06055 [Patescibacteria group bacterium]|nr:hypothetical protein [Patescibacteria group bacterium]